MDIEKYMINIEDVLEDADACFAHLPEGEGKKETLQEHTKRCQKYWKMMFKQRGLSSIFGNFEKMYLQGISEEGKHLFEVMTINIVTWHDFGKCNPLFQKEKMKHLWHMEYAPDNAIRSRHSILSVMFYLDYFMEQINDLEDKQERIQLKDFAYMYSYVISRHHGNLSDFSDYMEKLLGKETADTEKMAWEWYQIWKKEVLENGETVKLYPRFNNMKGRMEGQTQRQAIGLYAWIRLQFSLLTAADYYATSEFMSGIEVTDFGKFGEVQSLIRQYESGEVQQKIREYEKNTYPMQREKLGQVNEINILRTELFLEAEQSLKQHGEQSVFYLEAPTGSGKSNTAMNLSFTLMRENHDLRKLFYIYPFNTLVEQNLSILTKIFGNNKEIMSQIAVVNSLVPLKDKNEEEDRENSKRYQEILLDRQFLNYPFILSTHVMLFRTMFGNAKEDAFGFQQLCHSVIVLDEIQSYKINLWSEMITFLKEFSELLDIKVIIMSATLPNLEVLTDHNENAVRLIPDSAKYFKHKMFRERVVPNYDLLEEDMTLERLADNVLKNKKQKVLIEFIKKSSAEEFYSILIERNEAELVFLMTGDSSIQERKDLIEKINGVSSVILVATQVIEAGVDIDMDIGFKDISRLDSEEQFMGRINRSGKKNGTVYFFNLDETKNIYREDVRGDERFTLMVPEIRQLLETKNFSDFYEKDILPVLKKKGEMCNKNNLMEFFSQKVGLLNMPAVSEQMKLINDNAQGIYICFGRKLGDVDSRILWMEYKALLEDEQMGYAEKKVKLHDLRSEMNSFIYQFRNPLKIEANENIGDLYFIENGEEYFDENGVLKRELFGDDTDLFV